MKLPKKIKQYQQDPNGGRGWAGNAVGKTMYASLILEEEVTVLVCVHVHNVDNISIWPIEQQ